MPVADLAEILHGLGARLCRVSFFGMKWALSNAEPIIDHYIGRYREQMGSSVPKGMNSFDYGYRMGVDEIVLYGLSEAQQLSHQYSDGRVHEMCDMEGFGTIKQTTSIDVRISRVKIYLELCHEILYVVQRLMLDDMPSTLRMVRTRATQLRSLIIGWESLSEVERSSRLGGSNTPKALRALLALILSTEVNFVRAICIKHNNLRHLP